MDEKLLKEAVRARDGYRCTQCGMTNEQHKKLFRNQYSGKSLEVHRVNPGDPYTIEGCVTLCHTCHGTKPKSQPAPRINLLEALRVAFANGTAAPEIR